MTRNPFPGVAAGVLVAAMTFSACGGDDDSAATSTTAVESSDSTASATATATVDANTASIEEIAAAFEAAGVDNAERWAREAEEYRPYDASDNWAKLRDELSKYNIDDDTFERIISVLEA